MDDKNISIIYTSSAPYSAMQLASMIKTRTGAKWIADIRDPFTDGYMWLWPSKIHWHIARYIERFLLRYSDKVIVNTPAVKKLYVEKGIIDRSNIVVLTSGYSC